MAGIALHPVSELEQQGDGGKGLLTADGGRQLEYVRVRTQGQLVGGPHHQQGAEGGQIPAQPLRRAVGQTSAADHAVDGLGGGGAANLAARVADEAGGGAGALQQIPEFAAEGVTLKGDDDRIQWGGFTPFSGGTGLSR